MYARVVRFTGVSPEQISEVAERVDAEGGPPEGLPAKAMKMMYDESQSTCVVTVFFESEEDMRTGNEFLDKMDAGETPGTRASVDLCEVKVDVTV